MYFQDVEGRRLHHLPVETIVRIPIRKIPVVVNTRDVMTPELTLEDYRQLFGEDPDPSVYRIVNIEVITSPDDQQPMLVTECGRYSRFVRREGDDIYFRKQIEPS